MSATAARSYQGISLPLARAGIANGTVADPVGGDTAGDGVVGDTPRMPPRSMRLRGKASRDRQGEWKPVNRREPDQPPRSVYLAASRGTKDPGASSTTYPSGIH